VFCNGHCGQQKLPLQLTEEPGMGQQSLLIFIIYFPFLENRHLFCSRAFSFFFFLFFVNLEFRI
jgi:hypothetical protein